MKKSFRIYREEAVLSDATALMARLVRETGSQAQAESLARSLERMGSDPSVLSYVMTLESRAGRSGGLITSGWRVQADRGAVLEPVRPTE